MTDNQKRWLVAGIALNKILIPQIRPFVEQGVNTEYNNLKATHNIHGQSTPGRLQQWPARKFLKYENINGNDVHPRLPGKRFNYSLFDCRVTCHVDFTRLYVENYMAKFTAFDEHCDASAVLLLLGRVPAFNMAVQAAADVVRTVRNDWAHCVFSKWDQAKFLKSFSEMEQLVMSMALPTADETKLLGELKDWESKGNYNHINDFTSNTLLCLQVGVDGGVVWCLIMTSGFKLVLGVNHSWLLSIQKICVALSCKCTYFLASKTCFSLTNGKKHQACQISMRYKLDTCLIQLINAECNRIILVRYL